MIKVKVIEDFTLARFDEIKDTIVRASARNQDGHLYQNDTFECDLELAEYLTKTNKLNRAFVEVVEVIPETTAGLLQVEEVKEEKPKKEETKKVTEKATTSKKSVAKK